MDHPTEVGRSFAALRAAHTLLASVNPAALKEAFDVKSVTCERKRKQRGSYAKFSPERQAAIGKYASLKATQQLFGTFRSN